MHPNDISPQKNAFRPRRVDAPPKGMVKKKNEKNVKRIIFGTGKSWVVGGEKMKVRERLMRKVMAVVIAAATIFSISGGTKVVPAKDQVYENFHGALADDGILFIGSTEQILHAKELGFESLRTFFYKKMKI